MLGIVNAQRAWAYDLDLSQEGNSYTFEFKATTASHATLVFSNAEGVEMGSIDLGDIEAGTHTKVLPATEIPCTGNLNWAVKLTAEAINEVIKLTDDSKYNGFWFAYGVGVDNNPESEYFGNIYVSNPRHKTAPEQTGFYKYSPELVLDETIFENGEKRGYKPSNVDIATLNAVDAIQRMAVSPIDGTVAFVQWNSAPFAAYGMNPANLAGDAVNLTEGINQPVALCYDHEGALCVLSYDGKSGDVSVYGIHIIKNGEKTTFFSQAGWVAGGYCEIASDGQGGFYVMSGKLDAANVVTSAKLQHISKNATIDFEVLPGGAELEDAPSTFNRLRLAYDLKHDVFAIGGGKKVNLYNATYDVETGAPTLTKWTATPELTTNIDGIAFDYAGDLYVVSAGTETFYKFALPTANNTCTTPAASKYAFEIEGESVVEPVEMVGVVKRAVQLGESVVVLTHEADGTAHIYNVVGETITEVSQEGVVAVDPENAGDLLAISDIALTEDGKLVAINKIVCQASDAEVDEGYKRGETRVYIWNDLAGAPELWFTFKMSSNWYRSVQGHTMAYKGTSTNGTLFTTGVTATAVKFRYSVYNVINGVYTDPAVNDSEYYHYTKGSAQTTDNIGANYEINVSPLAENTWVLDGELIDPFEITDPLTYNTEVTASATVNEDLGKKYNGASYVTVGEQVLMVAPYATPEGKLIGVEILDITNGLAGALYVNMLYLDEAVEATAAATAVEVVEGDEATSLLITLVADATIYSLEATLAGKPDFQIYEDEITNLVIDLDNLVLIGGPSSAFQVDVYLGLGEYNRNDDTYQLLPESSIAVMGQDATFLEGYAYEVDAFTPSAKAVVRCMLNGMAIEFHLTMSAAPLEATKVVVENATVEIEKYLLWGDMYDYALKMTGEWVNPEDGLTYPVLVEVPVYYPEATEPSEIMSTVTVGGWGDNDPWLGFGEGTLTVTTVNGVVTATGIVQNPMAGIAIDITISGNLPQGPGTALENATVVIKSIKKIQNGQLIIVKDDVQYNAQGAVVK